MSNQYVVTADAQDSSVRFYLASTITPTVRDKKRHTRLLRWLKVQLFITIATTLAALWSSSGLLGFVSIGMIILMAVCALLLPHLAEEEEQEEHVVSTQRFLFDFVTLPPNDLIPLYSGRVRNLLTDLQYTMRTDPPRRFVALLRDLADLQQHGVSDPSKFDEALAFLADDLAEALEPARAKREETENCSLFNPMPFDV